MLTLAEAVITAREGGTDEFLPEKDDSMSGLICRMMTEGRMSDDKTTFSTPLTHQIEEFHHKLQLLSQVDPTRTQRILPHMKLLIS